MTRFSSMFSQLLQLFPRLEFEQAVKKHNAERGAKGFTSWGQFVAMQFCQFGRTKGAVKLHLLLDHDGYLPSYGVITDGKKSDIAVARGMKFAPGTVLVIDRGYNDYDWFGELTRDGVFFVTRMKDNAVYGVVEERNVPEKRNVLSDKVVFFYRTAAEGQEHFFCRIEVWDEE